MIESQLIAAFTQMPIPPSSNNMYLNVRGVGRVSSAQFRSYKDQMTKWAMMNSLIVSDARKIARGCLDNGFMFHVETYILFKKSRLYIKSGDCRRIDASNFTKAIHDQVALLIGIDDRYFWSESTIKKELTPDQVFESCTVLIFPYQPQTYDN